MSGDTSDPEFLARRFLDLWQEQVAASVADPALAQWLAGFMASPTAAATAGKPPDGHAFADFFTALARSNGPQNPGAPAAAAPSGPGDNRVDELARRLAACEKRLAALESGPGGAGKKTPKRAGKRQS